MEPDPVNVNEFQELARRVLPKMYYDFFAGAAEDEHTLRENVKAFSRIIIRPRILIDVSRIDLTTDVLGHHISAPIMVAPTAFHKLAHPEGELATAKAAAAHKTIMVVSFSSTTSLEEVAGSCSAVRFFQLYVFRNREISAWLVRRAERSGYKAIVITVDTPRLGRREADIKNKMIAPQRLNLEGLMSTEVATDKGSGPEAFANSHFDSSLSWKDIHWLRSITKLPILVKGVLTHEDATKAVEMGLDGIIVSNHGARQLDYAPATISVLEEIGRPVIFGLAAKGENGVKRVMEMLKDELELTMALAGCSNIKDITRDRVRTGYESPRSLL